MKVLLWLMAAVVGFAAMLWAYLAWQRIDPTAPWASGMMYIGAPGVPAPEDLKLPHVVARVRLLSSENSLAGIFAALEKDANLTRGASVQLSEKLLLLAPADAGITAEWLATGRLPRAGADEALAGFQTSHEDCLKVKGRTLQVVGVLRREVAGLAQSYLLPPSDATGDLFAAEDTAVRTAVLVRLNPTQMRDRTFTKALRSAFPAEPAGRFTAVLPGVRVDRASYYLYVAGMALLFLGGSGALIGIFAAWGRREHLGILRGPLRELAGRRRLLWGLHLTYFGLVVVAALVVYDLAPLQTLLMGLIVGQIADQNTLLGVVGKSYESHNILLAAGTTVAVNFLGGSLAFITLPSIVVPGIGGLLAAWRALLWGLLLAPTLHFSSSLMLPHSWTILLEGEGYILAAFFALLIPIYLLQVSAGVGTLRRYGRALLLNLAGNALVAMVLLVAACYEATEVILMMP